MAGLLRAVRGCGLRTWVTGWSGSTTTPWFAQNIAAGDVVRTRVDEHGEGALVGSLCRAKIRRTVCELVIR
jgi:hypothetical protein